MQGLNAQYRGGFINFNIEYKEVGDHYKTPFVVIDIQNSKFEVKPKEA